MDENLIKLYNFIIGFFVITITYMNLVILSITFKLISFIVILILVGFFLIINNEKEMIRKW